MRRTIGEIAESLANARTQREARQKAKNEREKKRARVEIIRPGFAIAFAEEPAPDTVRTGPPEMEKPPPRPRSQRPLDEIEKSIDGARDEEAGRGRRRTTTPSQDVEIVKRRLAGEPVAAIAAAFGLTKSIVYRALSDAGCDRTIDYNEESLELCRFGNIIRECLGLDPLYQDVEALKYDPDRKFLESSPGWHRSDGRRGIVGS